MRVYWLDPFYLRAMLAEAIGGIAKDHDDRGEDHDVSERVEWSKDFDLTDQDEGHQYEHADWQPEPLVQLVASMAVLGFTGEALDDAF